MSIVQADRPVRHICLIVEGIHRFFLKFFKQGLKQLLLSRTGSSVVTSFQQY